MTYKDWHCISNPICSLAVMSNGRSTNEKFWIISNIGSVNNGWTDNM